MQDKQDLPEWHKDCENNILPASAQSSALQYT